MKENIRDLNARRALQLQRQSPYNVINHEAEFPEKNKEGHLGKLAEERDYNIISNLHFEKHHYLPPQERPKERKVLDHVRSRTDTKEKRSLSNRPRDFDVVTNVYLEADEQKQSIDHHREKLLTQVKLINARRNPITGLGISDKTTKGKKTYQEEISPREEPEKRHVAGRSRYEFERDIANQSMINQDAREQRKLNRCTKLRKSVEDRQKREYDILTNN